MRSALPPTLVAALVMLVALAVDVRPGAAKEGVVARVLTPIPRAAERATTLTVVWTLSSLEEGKRRPFGAGAVFIRLFGSDARALGGRTPSR